MTVRSRKSAKKSKKRAAPTRSGAKRKPARKKIEARDENLGVAPTEQPSAEGTPIDASPDFEKRETPDQVTASQVNEVVRAALDPIMKDLAGAAEVTKVVVDPAKRRIVVRTEKTIEIERGRGTIAIGFTRFGDRNDEDE